MTIPQQPRTRAEVRAALEALRADDPPVHGGRVLAYVYDAGDEEATACALDALAAWGEVNALDPTTFPSVARLENDLVGWGLNLMRAPADAAGLVTSGGTESCILAVLAARTRWRALGRSGVPAVVVADTVHPAFPKAAHLLGVDLRVVPVDPSTFRLSAAAVSEALEELGDRATLVVASAPSYAHGVLDDVEGIAAVCQSRDVPLHVDACIGGVVLGYARRDGEPLPPCDFDVPGVTSLSMDLHKYGFAPKGVSLLLFRDAEYRSGTYFAYSSWPGYPVVNTTLQSTKSAGPMAAAWAMLQGLGDVGLADAIRRAREATRGIAAAVGGIPGMRVLGDPAATLIAIAAEPDGGAPGIDPFRLADRMRARGWVLQQQPSSGVLPRTVHLTVQPVSWDSLEQFGDDLRAAAAEAADLPWASADGDLAKAGALIAAIAAGESLPDETADLHALIDSLAPEVRDPSLAALFSALFTARR